MSGADPFFDSWHLMEFEQTEPFPVQDLAPTVPSQMGVSCWYPLPLVHRSPAAPSPSVEDSGLPPPGTNIPFDSRHRGTPSSRLEDSLASALHSRLHREETTYGRGTELRHESAPYSTYDQSISLPHAIDPRLLLSSTTPVINGPMGELPQVHIRETPPILDSSANGSANPAKNARFLRMHSKHRYECSWDDGSGKICGYSGTLREAKRHVKSVHPSSRSVVCQTCNKTLSSAYSFRLHANQHTGRNPFKCQDCEEAFKNPNSLRNHRIDHHGYIPKKKQYGGERKLKGTVDGLRT